MIHLNGFPCLEGEDHLHGLAVGAVMAGQTDGVRLANKTHEVGFSTSSEDSNSNSTALVMNGTVGLRASLVGVRNDANNFSILPWVGYVSSADLTKTIIQHNFDPISRGRDRNHFKEFRKRE
ncbi:hypothetical protein PSHT_10000 [Puccinia striiformis]|uniref:Uncharacterized protein n=1 Tax=Puccinia striiformis TaxID=27350 RepID=A0A2S4VCZ7_9BASI|nr:hypothetical protein PSHT_10000 [Puccinia striiformis]